MSEEPVAPSGPEPIPLSQARPVRAPVTRKPPPPPGPPSKVKAYLVIGIIVSSVVLMGLIGWRLYVKLTTKVVPPRNAKVEWENAWRRAKGANKIIFEEVEAKVWTKDETLTPEDVAKVKAGLETYQKTAETYHDLFEHMNREGKRNSQEAQDMGATEIVLKFWIWDANGVVDPASKPPMNGGLYIPMYHTEKKMDAATNRLKEIRDLTREIVARNNTEEILKVIKEIRGLRDTLAACRDEFLRLDDELVKGLTLPDLKEEQLPELKDLRTITAKSVMAFKEAGQIRSEFPSEEQLKEPPKQEPPKEEPPKEPPKETPPKEEPPKPEPPKDPPKEEPKKEEPKKEEPK